VYAATSQGLARFENGQWRTVAEQGRAVEQVAAGAGGVWYVAGGSLMKWSEGKSTQVAPLPQVKVNSIAAGAQVFVGTDQGLYVVSAGRLVADATLPVLLGADKAVRQVAVAADGRIAVAAASGLYLRKPHDGFRAVYPRSGNRSWAPHDVRAVSFDSRGRFWFASPQGAGVEDGGAWTLFTGHDGLPYDDFTTAASGGDGAVWFGTRIGAERFDGVDWEYRQGLRWLPDDDVRSIAVNANGDAWFATSKGLSLIERRPTTLQEKAS
jgi:ligand-binding sensor domain-containing protein